MATAQEILAARKAASDEAATSKLLHYFHRIPGAKVMVQIGQAQVEEYTFFGGHLAVEEGSKLHKHLEDIADRPGTMVYTDQERAKSLSPDELASVKDAMEAAGTAHRKMLAAGESTA